MKISKFSIYGIRTTWTLLYICYNSPIYLRESEYDEPFVKRADIEAYAIEVFLSSNDQALFNLISVEKSDYIKFSEELERVHQEHKNEFDFEFRKFRVLYVIESIPERTEDLITGFLRINEIWSKFSFPEDTPNISIKFSEYSTQIYHKLLDDHHAWICKELDILKGK
jgi:hypothetical protein